MSYKVYGWLRDLEEWIQRQQQDNFNKISKFMS